MFLPLGLLGGALVHARLCPALPEHSLSLQGVIGLLLSLQASDYVSLVLCTCSDGAPATVRVRSLVSPSWWKSGHFFPISCCLMGHQLSGACELGTGRASHEQAWAFESIFWRREEPPSSQNGELGDHRRGGVPFTSGPLSGPGSHQNLGPFLQPSC